MDDGRTSGAVAVAVLLGYAVFEVALAAGAPWGRWAWGGRSTVLPLGLRLASGIAAVVYAGLAVLIARRVGFLGHPIEVSWSRTAVYVAAGFVALGVPMNLLSRSTPERFQAIGAGALAISLLLVARSSPV